MSSKVHSHDSAVDPVVYDGLNRPTIISNSLQQTLDKSSINTFLSMPSCISHTKLQRSWRVYVIAGIILTVNTAQESAECPPPWSRNRTGPWEPLQ